MTYESLEKDSGTKKASCFMIDDSVYKGTVMDLQAVSNYRPSLDFEADVLIEPSEPGYASPCSKITGGNHKNYASLLFEDQARLSEYTKNFADA